ncbi:MAG: aldo/keto reductase [Geminicoccaceae bacterium]
MNRASAIELRPGYWISTVIKGYGISGGELRDLGSAAALADLNAFFESGITAIDCGDCDPSFERLLGSFRQDLHRTHVSAKAQTLRVHTKFNPNLSGHVTPSQEQVESSIDQSLARLGLEALDLVQFQWPDHGSSACLDVLGYLTLMQAKDKIQHLGITNADTTDLRMLMQSGINLASAQVPFSLIDQRPKGDFANLCKQHNIALLAYGTLAGGFISHRWLGAADPGYDFENPLLARHRLVIEAFGGWGLFQELLLALGGIGARHGITLGGVALRAMHDHADVASIIMRAPGSPELKGYLRAFSFSPTVRDREALAAVLAKRSGPDGPVFGIERARADAKRRSTKTIISALPSFEGQKKEARRIDG